MDLSVYLDSQYARYPISDHHRHSCGKVCAESVCLVEYPGYFLNIDISKKLDLAQPS